MSEIFKAIRFKSLDEAAQVLDKTAQRPVSEEIFDDRGEEPQGLLSVISSDMVSEEIFYRLFDQKKGVLVEVERIPYSGFGPPAEEMDYMGFVGRQSAYVLKGCRLRVEISDCPRGARDIHHLEAQILDKKHPLNREDLAERLSLPKDWEFEDLFELIVAGRRTASEIDRLIHRGIQ